MKWTEAQGAAIALRDKNILVSAAAGSGKTAVLVERIKRLILQEGVSLNEMLIVTFSNAAAAEMKEKIVAAINKEMDVNQEQQEFLRKQINLIYKANISTFHAFAMEVIRRYFHLVGIDPDFRICDEAQKTILQAEAMEQLFSELFDSRDQEFLDFLRHFAGSKNEDGVKDMILAVHTFIQSIPKPYEWLDQSVEALNCTKEEFAESPLYAQLFQCMREDLQLTEAYIQQVQDMLEMAGLESLSQKNAADLTGIQDIAGALEQEGAERALQLAAAFSFQRFAAKKDEKESYAAIKEELTAVRDKGKKVLKDALDQYGSLTFAEALEELHQIYPQAQCLQRLVKGFAEKYQEKKRKKKLIDFNDIEHYALEILEHDEAAAEYRGKFRYIFIDEYQDSNVVQETLIGRIKRENNVFMVGDVKQSIYKFRLAEPELFISKYERYKTEASPVDCKIDLNRNFRSKKNIIYGINHIFRQIMNQRTTGMEYDDAAALYVGVENPPAYDFPVSLHLVDDAVDEQQDLPEDIAEMKKLEIEAHTAARLLKQAYGKRIYDGKKGCERPASYRDMVVLLRSAKTTGQTYFQALSDAGIPCFADSSDGYFDTVEIQIFLNLLRIIDNGSQDLPLLSVMRSVIFRYDLEELAEIRVHSRRSAYYKALKLYAQEGENKGLREKAASTIAQLERWRKEAVYLPLEEFLWKLIRETGYERFVSAIPGGEQRKANLKALVDKAVQYQSAQMKGLFGFIRYIEALQKQKISTGEVRLVGENDDVVRIMTIHKSKGLEFPIVLVGGLGKRLGGGRDLSTVSMHRNMGLALRLVQPEAGLYSKTLLQFMIERKRKKEDMAEEIRILYVAFTRAMDELMLLGSVTDAEQTCKKYRSRNIMDAAGAKSYLDFVFPALDGSDIAIHYHHRSEVGAVHEQEQQEKEYWKNALEQGFPDEAEPQLADKLTETLARRFSYQYPYREHTEIKSKYTVSQLAGALRQEEPAQESERQPGHWDAITVVTEESHIPKFMKETHVFTGAQRGNVLHSILEFIPFSSMSFLAEEQPSGTALKEAVSGYVDDMVQRELLTEEERSIADLDAITGFFTSNVGKRACRASTVEKEAPFNLKMQVEGKEALVQGVIDCYFTEKDGTVLVDYKSNAMLGTGTTLHGQRAKELEEELRRTYEMQLSIYKKALEEISEITVKEVYIYSFALGKELLLEV